MIPVIKATEPIWKQALRRASVKTSEVLAERFANKVVDKASDKLEDGEQQSGDEGAD